MGKIRIYELAKELGLENKAVLALCEQLGVEGKSSHSNSLSEDEAQKIRRSVIRRAVSGRKVTREIEREGGRVTERRMGSVIRRRKKSEPEVETSNSIDFTDVPTREEQSYTPNLERQRNERDEALARANALFKTKPVEEAPVEEPVQEAVAQPVEEAVPEASEETPAVTEEAAPQSLLAVEEAPTEEVIEEPVEEKSPEEPVVASAPEEQADSQEADEQNASESLEEVRQRHDIRAPKVLGRINLPSEPKPKPKAEKVKETVVPSVEEPQAVPVGGKRSAKKKKGADLDSDSEKGFRKKRKKQVLRKDDLVDYDGDRDGWRGRRDKKSKKSKGDSGGSSGTEITTPKASKRVVKVQQEISVGELAKEMGIKAGEVVKKLMGLGVMATINQMIDFDTATLVADEFDFTIQSVGETEEEFVAKLNTPDKEEDLEFRAPVVTIMGHVDHGKTSLLDAIRQTEVASGEAGGITQHIGAYTVKTSSGGRVTFLDTPGHAAFTAMRGRGAQVTDIVVLVVAADDGVMPQTVEAINHARAAEVPIILAINKIDKEEAQPDRIMQQVAEHELVPEEWGGDTIVAKVSAHTRQGLDELLESLYLQAELLELKANPKRTARGCVIESRLDKQRGPVITVLVQNGTLKKGDVFFTGATWGKVRALHNDHGQPLEEAGPSIPVEVLGVSEPPEAGDDFYVLETESEARRIAEQRAEEKRKKDLASKNVLSAGPLTLESFSEMVGTGDVKELALIVKADVQGSVEAVCQSLLNLGTDDIKVKIVHRGAGAITENDVQLALASKAIIVGFSVRADKTAATVAENEGVEVFYSRVIYELVDAVKSALEGMLEPIKSEKTLGRVEVRQTFKVPKLGVIAGSYVTDGMIERGSLVRLLRDSRVMFEGKMASLRRFKEDVKEVQAGYECGIGIEGYSDIQDGDVIEVYKIEEIKQTL